MRSIYIFIVLCFISSCASGPQLGEKTGLPGKSIASISPALYRDSMSNLSAWLKLEKSCGNFEVTETEVINHEGKVIINNKGQLFAGTITEHWNISYCNTQAKIGIVFQPDGKGGNYIAISEINGK